MPLLTSTCPCWSFNLGRAIENNIVGTMNLVETASEFGCARFVLVSTDKAVRPANVMGATKRIAEMIA